MIFLKRDVRKFLREQVGVDLGRLTDFHMGYSTVVPVLMPLSN
jgi:hypothetical protein